MKITEVHIRLPVAGENSRLLAYCDLVLDGEYAVHDLKLIQGDHGVMLSMPSRWRRHHCPDCHQLLNDPRASYCSWCGRSILPHDPSEERVDVFHPISSDARAHLQCEIMKAYQHRVDSTRVSGG